MSTDNTKAGRVRTPPSPAIFEYVALISTKLIHSDTRIVPGFSMSDVRSAALIKLPYLPDTWSSTPSSGEEEITHVALSKMLKTLALREGVKTHSSSDMEALFDDRYGDVVGLADDPDHKQYECVIQLHADGKVTWSFTQRKDGKYFGKLQMDLSGNDLSLDDYLIAQLKRDLYHRLDQ